MTTSTCLPASICKVITVVLCFAVLCSTAFAGMISSIQMFGSEAGTGPGMGTVSDPVVLTFYPNNDNQAGGGPLDNNITVPIKRFDHIGYIDMVFNVVPTNGVTEYKIYESVDNNTGLDWDGYAIQLGFGIGPAFVPYLPSDELDFDFPTYDSPPVSSAFPTILPLGADVLQFLNGIHSSGMETYQFRVDVPDLLDVPGHPESFTIRQFMRPIPEPSVYLLLLCALTCMWFYRNHHP